LPLAPQAARPNTSTAASTVTRNLRLWKGFFIPGIYPRMLADNGLLPKVLAHRATLQCPLLGKRKRGAYGTEGSFSAPFIRFERRREDSRS